MYISQICCPVIHMQHTVIVLHWKTYFRDLIIIEVNQLITDERLLFLIGARCLSNANALFQQLKERQDIKCLSYWEKPFLLTRLAICYRKNTFGQKFCWSCLGLNSSAQLLTIVIMVHYYVSYQYFELVLILKWQLCEK